MVFLDSKADNRCESKFQQIRIWQEKKILDTRPEYRQQLRLEIPSVRGHFFLNIDLSSRQLTIFKAFPFPYRILRRLLNGIVGQSLVVDQ